ncbi:MAG: protein kinase domain-containing protein [Gemmatimonadaceae bacterium]
MIAPRTAEPQQRRITRELPQHLAGWELPPGWRWGPEGIESDYRHYQEVLDGLGRSLSLVTAPDPAHHRWLHAEAVKLAHRSHPSIPTTYHYWTALRERGPGYLRRWVSGETVGSHFERLGAAEVPYVLRVLRGAGSTLAYVHDLGSVHGALSAHTLWTTPTGRLWMLQWQWSVSADDRPAGLRPDLRQMPRPPEWGGDEWRPTAASDQWQLAAICFTMLTGEAPPQYNSPPVKLLRPETPESVALAIDRALLPEPGERFPSIGAMIRAAERGYAAQRSSGSSVHAVERGTEAADQDERRVRDAVGDDYEILSKLGSGTFGTVWRARDLALEREVALKVLHPRVARNGDAVSAFWREARLAAQLAHPAIVPIYDWDGNAGFAWYTMELAEGGSVAQLVARRGSRSISTVASQVELILDGLGAAHSIGVVHRDLKPENILIDRYQRWRLTDFGIANASGEEASEREGTLGFSAPEQLLGEPQGPAVDLFALAAIVAYVLTGELPFPGGDPHAVLAQQLGERVDLSSLPATLASWVQKGLAPVAAERFPDAAAMQADWREAVADALKRERARRWWRSWLPAVQR